MATQFSGGTYVSTTFTGATKQNIIDGIEAALLTAGWTTVSGHGTGTLLMQSATQANVTNPIRVRIKDNGGSCATVSIENQAGSVAGANDTSNGGHLLPGVAQNFRVLATKYHFLCFYVGAATGQRQFVMAGMTYVPTFLSPVTDHGYMLCNSQSDGGGSALSCLRVDMRLCAQNANPNWQVIWNSSINQASNDTGSGHIGVGTPKAVVMTDIDGTSAGPSPSSSYRWAGDQILTSDVLLSAGLTSYADEGKLKGQFFDMLYLADAFAADTTDTFASHDWFCLVNSNSSQWPRGGVWIATS